MSSTSEAGGGGRAPRGLAATLEALRRSATECADVLLQHVPDTGDHATGRVVDAFVEQAGDALRALAEGAGASLRSLDDDATARRDDDGSATGVADRGAGPAPGRRARAPWRDEPGWR